MHNRPGSNQIPRQDINITAFKKKYASRHIFGQKNEAVCGGRRHRKARFVGRFSALDRALHVEAFQGQTVPGIVEGGALQEVVQRSCATSCFWFGGMVCTWFALTLCEARDSCCCPRKSIACDREIITCVVGQFCYSRLQEKKSGGRMTINHNVLRKPRKLLVCTGRTAVVTTRDMQGCSVPVVSMMMK